jgi:glutamyl-tRNA synthetase
MLNAEGTRLAKRIGSEDLSGICARGYSAAAVRCYLAWTLGVAEPGETPSLPEMAKRWSLAKVPREDVRFREEELRPWG